MSIPECQPLLDNRLISWLISKDPACGNAGCLGFAAAGKLRPKRQHPTLQTFLSPLPRGPIMRYRYLLVAASLLIALTAASPARAVLPFYTVFKKEYLDKHPDKKFVEEVNKASNRCFVCHQGKTQASQRVRQAFGGAAGQEGRPQGHREDIGRDQEGRSRCTSIPKTTRAKPISTASRPASGRAASSKISRRNPKEPAETK